MTTPYRLAGTAETALRELNHVTFPGKRDEGWEYVGDVYDVAGSLGAAVYHLRQTVEQMSGFLRDELAAGRVASRGQSPTSMVAGAQLALADAAKLAVKLSVKLAAAQVATRDLYVPDPVSDVEACGCGGQGCDTCGGTYVMVVPGQSVSEGDHDEHQEQAGVRPADQI